MSVSPEAQIALWGLATVFPFCLNMALKRHPDAIGLSGVLVMIWSAQRVMWSLWTPPQCMTLYPLLDAIAGATAFTAWVSHRGNYKLCLSFLFLAQCILHFDFWVGWLNHKSDLWTYIAANNAIYAAELWCVAWPGVAYGSRLLVRRLSAGARAVHSAGP